MPRIRNLKNLGIHPNDREFTYSGFCGDGATREELLVLGTDQRTRQMWHDEIGPLIPDLRGLF